MILKQITLLNIILSFNSQEDVSSRNGYENENIHEIHSEIDEVSLTVGSETYREENIYK